MNANVLQLCEGKILYVLGISELYHIWMASSAHAGAGNLSLGRLSSSHGQSFRGWPRGIFLFWSTTAGLEMVRYVASVSYNLIVVLFTRRVCVSVRDHALGS